MVISVLDLYFITYSWSWSVNDGRGGVESASVAVIVQPPINHFPEAQDQDVSVNENRIIKIKLEAKDPDDNKLRFILVSQPSKGKIVQFAGQAVTLAYVLNPPCLKYRDCDYVILRNKILS
jgi:cadherin-like protein